MCAAQRHNEVLDIFGISIECFIRVSSIINFHMYILESRQRMRGVCEKFRALSKYGRRVRKTSTLGLRGSLPAKFGCLRFGTYSEKGDKLAFATCTADLFKSRVRCE